MKKTTSLHQYHENLQAKFRLFACKLCQGLTDLETEELLWLLFGLLISLITYSSGILYTSAKELFLR